MTFQISAMPAEPFADLFTLSDEELAEQRARRMIVTAKPGTPCRVSMADAEVGETVILVNYQHQPADSPFQANHAIFVRDGAVRADLAAGEVPDVIRSRLMSLRLFDKDHMMIDADVVDGKKLGEAIVAAFADRNVAYAHLHYAKPGCFAATVTRVD